MVIIISLFLEMNPKISLQFFYDNDKKVELGFYYILYHLLLENSQRPCTKRFLW